MSGTTARRQVPAQGTESAARVADVLLTVSTSPDPVGVTHISRTLGLSKAVVYRILQSLESRHLVRFHEDERVYGLGTAALALGARALRQQDLRTAALPVLRRLQKLTGETVTVSALTGTSRIYLDQIVSHRELKMMVEIGRAFPLHAGSSSKAILAFAPDDLRDHVLTHELAALTTKTIVDDGSLEEELDRIARMGVAVSRGERQHGAGSVAAPIFGPDDEVIGSISVCGPINRFDSQTFRRYAPLVKKAAQEISTSLHDRATTAPPLGPRHG